MLGYGIVSKHSFKIIIIGYLLLITAIWASSVRVPAPPADLYNSWGERKVFDYQGIKINYYEAGQGPPVILLHGFGAFAYSWRHLIPPLAAEHRVFTLELKGHGLSDKPADGHYAVADQADMVADFIRRQDLHDLVIMGHSLGGAVGLVTYFKLREEDPGRITKLVLIDSAGYPQELPLFIRMAKVPGLYIVLNKLVPPRFAALVVLQEFYYKDEEITKEQVDTFAYYSSLPGVAAAMSQTAKQIMPPNIEAFTEKFKTIKIPVLVIWGDEDEVTPLEVGKKFERDIPGAQLVILARCGHFPMAEEPLATRLAIVAFLKKQ